MRYLEECIIISEFIIAESENLKFLIKLAGYDLLGAYKKQGALKLQPELGLL